AAGRGPLFGLAWTPRHHGGKGPPLEAPERQAPGAFGAVLYPLLAQSNTRTVRPRAQSLAPGTNRVTGEYRGSTTIERFMDAAEASRMLARFLTPKVAEAALRHPAESVRALGGQFLRELAEEGNPYARDFLRAHGLVRATHPPHPACSGKTVVTEMAARLPLLTFYLWTLFVRVVKERGMHTEAVTSRDELLLVPAKLIESGRQKPLKLAVSAKWWAAISQACERLQRWPARTELRLDVQQPFERYLCWHNPLSPHNRLTDPSP
ncbi:MAG: hypothetical protein N2322_04310, partial [Terrimicrobiaceae bacterium]|nr:hypothetical protein [Terrimicrobiaceae bacterium]